MTAICAGSLGGSAIPSSGPERGDSSAQTVTQLSGGSTIDLPTSLQVGQYFEVEFEQVEGDVALELLDPSGRVVATSDLPGKPWISEVLATVVESGGTYDLRVTAMSSPHASVAEVGRISRPGRSKDEDLVAALAQRSEAWRTREAEVEGSLGAAAGLFEAAAGTLRTTTARDWLARVLRELGRCQQTMGEMDRALESYVESISLLRLVEDERQLAKSLNYYGVLLLEKGEREAARGAFDEALTMALRSGDRADQAESWNNLGVYYYYQGQMDEVVEAFERSLEVGARAGRVAGRANTLANLGEVYRALGRYSDALRLSEESLALARRLGDASQEMRVLNNRGVLLKGVGDLRAAIEDYEASLELAQRLGEIRWLANIGSNLGAIYRVMGHRQRALDYLGDALEAAVTAGSASDEIWALLTIGEIHRENGDEKAEQFLSRALERSKASDDRGGQAYSFYGLGRLRQDAGNAAVAAELLERSLDFLEEVSDRPGQLAAHRELARALADLGDSAGASTHFESAVALARLVGDPYQESMARARWARFLLTAGNLGAARREVSAALMTIESLREGVVEPDLRAGLLSRSQRDFALLVDILQVLDHRFPGQGYLDQAFAVVERARARSLVELLTESESDLIRDLPAELARRRSDITGALSSTQGALTRALSSEDLDREMARALRARVRDLNLEREALERDIRLSDARWNRLVYPQPLDIAGTQALLEPGQALVSFLLGEDASFVFVVTPSQRAFERIAPEGELRPLIEEVRAHLERPGRRSRGRFRAVAAQLYGELLAPVERLLEDRTHLMISPDGLLHYLPFEALVQPVDVGRGERYLLSKWAVSYLPSASTLEALKTRRPRSSDTTFDLAAFADPVLPGAEGIGGAEDVTLRGLGERDTWRWRQLAGARAEVESIAGLFDPGRVRVYYGAEASERRFREEAAVSRARYLHLASHAVIDGSEPALSAVLLTADGSAEDGLLQAHEIFELELDADLVVLSGCETALGREVRGEGLLGMSRAFLYAGAEAVAVSLWPVEDASTAELMVGFYEELSRGTSTALALRKAKLDRIGKGAGAHPYFWAPFVLVGSSS